eukprot:TRINITY_DN5181_c0_g1_i1.p1 TRINITY_DN5181_c0_g1~~TRINITY_DN5181_c0_g1_i1.p1  ORF type:complete len:235 (+),score=48.67 TRINITY_DN5181_c0_g1_i1:254-958(+)
MAKVCHIHPQQLQPLSLSICSNLNEHEWPSMDDDWTSECEEDIEHLQWEADLDEQYQIHVASAMSIISSCRENDRLTNPDKRKHAPAELLPYLYLGDGEDAMDVAMLQQLGVSAVVNCAASSTLTSQAHYPAHFSYLAFDAMDQPEYDLLGQHLEAFWNFVEEARQSNRVVFVHCQAGVNRSATLCLAYLMLSQRMALLPAVKHCARRRPCILRNEGFIEQLVVFAAEHDLLES